MPNFRPKRTRRLTYANPVPSVDPEWRSIIAQSRLWDPEWYARTHHRAMPSEADPLDHFLGQGAQQGLDPSPLFDVSWYSEAYPEVIEQGINPFVDYLKSGYSQHRNPNLFFDSAWYLARNPDVQLDGINPLEHYVLFGEKEGRDPSPLFSAKAYLERNRDVAAAEANALKHYLEYGQREKRAVFSLAQLPAPCVAAFARVEDYTKPQVADWLNGLVRAGYDVDVYLTNSSGTIPLPLAEWLPERLRTTKPDFGLSFNGAFASDGTVGPLNGRMFMLLDESFQVTEVGDGWLEHLEAATTSRRIAQQLNGRQLRSSPARYWPLPFGQPVQLTQSEKRYDVVVVADHRKTEQLNQLLRADLSQRKLTRSVVQQHLKAATGGATPSIRELLVDKALCQELWLRGLKISQYVRLLQSYAVNFEIKAALGELQHHRASLFGDDGWIEEFLTSPERLALLQNSAGLVTADDVRAAYDRSRIALVIPDRGQDGVMPLEATCALVSQALFVAPHRAEAELVQSFGPGAPIVVYRSLPELHELTEHYLHHEQERLDQVFRTHVWVGAALDFCVRLKEIEVIIGAPNRHLVRAGSLTYRMADAGCL